MYYSSISGLRQPIQKFRKLYPIMSIQDLSIGIPLNIFSNIFTNLHYGYDITSIQNIILQFLLGYYSYGIDRLKDAKEYQLSNNITIYPDNKIQLYNNILTNNNYENTLNLSLIGILYLLFINDFTIQKLPFIFLLYLSANYKEYKQYLSIFKPFYIATMWTITSVILPSVLYDNNYNIILYPQDYLPCLLFIFSASNFADINDIEEDKKLGVNTIPVLYGKQITEYISFIAITISSILLIENPNFENRFWINLILEIQQLGLMYIIYNNN